jgi:hypothetical protein
VPSLPSIFKFPADIIKLALSLIATNPLWFIVPPVILIVPPFATVMILLPPPVVPTFKTFVPAFSIPPNPIPIEPDVYGEAAAPPKFTAKPVIFTVSPAVGTVPVFQVEPSPQLPFATARTTNPVALN